MADTKHVYLLIDPRTGGVKYVGCTEDPERRLKGHIADATKTRGVKLNNPRIQWLRELEAFWLKPIMIVLFEGEDAEEVEQELIKKFVEAGVSLTNAQYNDRVVVRHRPWAGK